MRGDADDVIVSRVFNLVVACSVIFLLLISTYFIFCLPFWLSAKTTTANEGRNTQFHLHGKSILSSSYLWFRKINQIIISHCRKDASGKVEWMIKAEQWQSRPADTHRGWLMVLSLNLFQIISQFGDLTKKRKNWLNFPFPLKKILALPCGILSRFEIDSRIQFRSLSEASTRFREGISGRHLDTLSTFRWWCSHSIPTDCLRVLSLTGPLFCNLIS